VTIELCPVHYRFCSLFSSFSLGVCRRLVGGKRWRPTLMLLTAEALGAKIEDVIDFVVVRSRSLLPFSYVCGGARMSMFTRAATLLLTRPDLRVGPQRLPRRGRYVKIATATHRS
jgi:hypothetical protein